MPLNRSAALNQGLDPRAVLDFLDAQSELEMHSLTVLLHGAVVAQGWWHPHTADDRAQIYSLSKTVASAAVGLCVERGWFGYDDAVADLLPDLATGASATTRTIRVRDCLAMATGHTTDLIDHLPGRIIHGRDDVRVLFEVEPEGEPGVTFCYNQLATFTLAVLVQEFSGTDLATFVDREVFTPIGVGGIHWQRTEDGTPHGWIGLHPTIEQLACFWQLVADDGVHDGRRILPREWIENHRLKQVETFDPNADPSDQARGDWAHGYGWQCWMQAHGYRGDGAFGQYGIVHAEQDLVVVVTSEVDDMQPTIVHVLEHLVAGVGRPGTAADQAELDARLATLTIPALGGELPATTMTGSDGQYEVKAIPEGDGLVLELTDLAAPLPQRIPVGRNQWLRSEMVWPDRHLGVAASGGMVDGELVVRLVLTNSPHSATIRLGKDSPVFGWTRTPLVEQWTLVDLAIVETPCD